MLSSPVDVSAPAHGDDNINNEPPWKSRKYGHNTDFKHKRIGTSKKGTTLSKYIWTLKDPDNCNTEPCPVKMEYQIKWKILARAKGYNPITGLCRLCLKESYFILFKPETHTTPEWANQQKLRPENWYTTYCQGPLGLPKNAFGQI